MMEQSDIRNQLELKPVGLEHLNQFNELLRYVFQVTDSDLEESGYDNEKEMVRDKIPVLDSAEVFGWFNKEKLISQIAIYPCVINIHGKLFNMGGVTGVGTYPEYSNFGLMHDLIILALENMRKNKQWISLLFPFDIPYYRRKGWEIISDKMTFKVKDTQLPKQKHVDGLVDRVDIDHEDVIKIYDKFAKKNHGALIRNGLNWEEYWRWENEEERIAAIYYDSNEEPMGFCFYWIEHEIFHIKEIIYLSQEAREAIWNFISAHFSMIEYVKGNNYTNEPIAFQFDESEIKETIEPYYMGRIVDVYQFLLNYSYATSSSKPFHFIVEDRLASWNQGVFSLSWNHDNKIEVSREPLGNPVRINIQTLTALMMSYKRPSYLYKIERIDTDLETLNILEKIIPDQKAYFSDYY